VTAGSGVGGRLPAFDGGPGGVRSAPPAIDQGIVDYDAVRHRGGVGDDAGVLLLVGSAPTSETTARFGRP
jgi:hypothetical protein